MLLGGLSIGASRKTRLLDSDASGPLTPLQGTKRRWLLGVNLAG